MGGYFVEVERQLEGVAGQEDDHNEGEHRGDGHLPPLPSVEAAGGAPPAFDDLQDPGVEYGQGGHGEQVEKDRGEEH